MPTENNSIGDNVAYMILHIVRERNSESQDIVLFFQSHILDIEHN